MAESKPNLLKICRLCLHEITENEEFFKLNIDEPPLKLKLLAFMPEIDIDILPNPISCIQCTTTINLIYDFKQRCSETENIITNLRLQNIPFSNVLEYLKKSCEIQIKEEFLDETFKVEPSENNEVKFEHTKPPEQRDKKIWFCPDCSYQTSCKNNLIRHGKIHQAPSVEQGKLMCPHCNYSTIYRGTFGKHLVKCHIAETVSKKFQCDLCDYSSDAKNRFNLHVKMHHKKNLEPEKKTFKCDMCSFETHYKNNLLRHAAVIHHRKPEKRYREKTDFFECFNCKYSTKCKWNLVKHMIRFHGADKEVRKYPCALCDYSCDKYSKLVIHSAGIHNKRPKIDKLRLKEELGQDDNCSIFYCNDCDFETYNKKSLLHHCRFHLASMKTIAATDN